MGSGTKKPKREFPAERELRQRCVKKDKTIPLGLGEKGKSLKKLKARRNKK